jgi:hypothetical protein
MKEEIFMEKTVGNAVKGGSFLVDEITIEIHVALNIQALEELHLR